MKATGYGNSASAEATFSSDAQRQTADTGTGVVLRDARHSAAMIGRTNDMTNAEVVAASCRTPPGSIRWTKAQPQGNQGTPQVMAEFRVLGPVEAVVAGRLVDLGAPKQRALLALLVSRVGQPVTVDVMLEELWAGNPPPSAMTSLQAYVANLRRVLEPDRAPRTPATVLRTRGQGYLLDSRVVEVDVHRFGERATAGWQAWDRGDPQQALTEFEAGLALWRGQAYTEVADAPYVVPERARLEELRLSVVERRCAALLAVGAHEVAVAELEAFVQAHPLREYGCELLSLALYRAGRQADALAVLRNNQKRLAEELGIDPRPALQHLERDILNQAPALDWHPTPAVPESSSSLDDGNTDGPGGPSTPAGLYAITVPTSLPYADSGADTDAVASRDIAEESGDRPDAVSQEGFIGAVSEGQVIQGTISNVQFLHAEHLTEVRRDWLMTFPIDSQEILDASSKAVLPPRYEGARVILARRRVVVLADEPGTGRRTAALALLHSLREASVRPGGIETDGEPPKVAKLPLDHRHAFLLDLNDPETDVPAEEFGRALLREHVGRLDAAQSYLLITVTPQIWAACAESAADITVSPGRPDPRQVCERHLRVAGGLEERISWLDEPDIKSLLKPASRPSDMARLASEIASAPDTDAGRREVVNRYTNLRRKVREVFAKNPTPADRAFAVAAAALDNSSAHLILAAADKLLEKLGGSVPAASPLAGEPLSERLEKINTDPDNGMISVSGQQHDLDHAILLHVWDQWPRCQGTLLEWLADPLPPGAGHQQSLYKKLADVLLRLAVEREPAPVMEALRQWWSRPERRELAVSMISAAATHHRIGDRVRHRLYGWAKKTGDRDLACTVADVCGGELGRLHPDIALTQLRHLAASEDEAVSHAVVRALSSLAVRPDVSSAAAREITRWITSSEAARQRTGRAAFLQLAASYDSTGGLALLRPDGPLPELAVSGWRAVLDERPGPPIDERVAVLAGWFKAARPDSPHQDEILEILAAAAGNDPARNVVLLDLCQFWAEQADTPEDAQRRLAVCQELLQRRVAASRMRGPGHQAGAFPPLPAAGAGERFSQSARVRPAAAGS